MSAQTPPSDTDILEALDLWIEDLEEHLKSQRSNNSEIGLYHEVGPRLSSLGSILREYILAGEDEPIEDYYGEEGPAPAMLPISYGLAKAIDGLITTFTLINPNDQTIRDIWIDFHTEMSGKPRDQIVEMHKQILSKAPKEVAEKLGLDQQTAKQLEAAKAQLEAADQPQAKKVVNIKKTATKAKTSKKKGKK
jgi:hypothetical protein